MNAAILGNLPEPATRKRMTTSFDTGSSQVPAQDHAGCGMAGKKCVRGIKIGVVQLSVLHIGGSSYFSSINCQTVKLAQKKTAPLAALHTYQGNPTEVQTVMSCKLVASFQPLGHTLNFEIISSEVCSYHKLRKFRASF